MISHLKIKETDIYLHDYGSGKGKITLSDPKYGAFATQWNAMGGSFDDFLLCINGEYFADNLCGKKFRFDAKLSVRNIRKYIRENLSSELPFYRFMSAQKEMREDIKRLEDCNTQEEFVTRCSIIPNNLICSGLTWDEQNEFESIIEDVFKSEPWHFIEEVESQEYQWLKSLLGKIKEQLQNKVAA